MSTVLLVFLFSIELTKQLDSGFLSRVIRTTHYNLLGGIYTHELLLPVLVAQGFMEVAKKATIFYQET